MTPKTSSSAASGKHQNILAPVSLVCGLLAWTLLPIIAALAAILTGHIAYAKNKRLKVGGKGMALTGLVIPPAAVPILSAQQRVEETLNAGTPLDEINETHEEAGEGDPSLRYWQRIEIKQGNIVITPKPNIYGLSAQIMLFSTRENGGLSWTCVGELDKTVEETVCR